MGKYSALGGVLSDDESGRQIQRYIRLTYLIPEILQMVDEKKIALTPAVELSYLTESQQRDLLETMEPVSCVYGNKRSRNDGVSIERNAMRLQVIWLP